MATACERLDSLVKDYLLFRGFTATAKTFDHELKQDKDRGLRADKILEQLLAYIGTYDLQHLRENWAYLNHRFFSRLEQRYASSVRKLEISLLKLYVVNAQQNNRQDRVRDFFERMGPELQNQQEFRDWFAFPFLSSPAENSTFSLYFSKQWQETLQLSLHNFLQVVLQAMPVPTLLNFDHDYRHMLALQEENEFLKSQLHAGGPVVDKRVGRVKTSKDSSPQPLPDLIYDFSGLAEYLAIVQTDDGTGRIIGVVLGKDGGMIQSLYVPYLLGLGGRIGKGDQWFPWIHVKDVAGLVTYAIMHDHVSGILNGVAPEAVTSAEFARIFGRVLRRPSVVPVPGFVMKAVFGRERSHVVLDGQKVIPKRTLETGYPFSYPCLVSACQDFR